MRAERERERARETETETEREIERERERERESKTGRQREREREPCAEWRQRAVCHQTSAQQPTISEHPCGRGNSATSDA